jgi:hypothetical protein
MVTLEGKVEADLLNSNGDVIYFGNNSILISVDTPKDEEIRRSSRYSFIFESENRILDNRTIDYICGLLSPAEYKMPRKKHRKNTRIKKRLRKTQGIVLKMEK